ncbi:hypothetical protein D5S18_17955 [Nocardia panacis]|uniref:Uncharacterized protein n=1 Tax=Nocardia panacis TaxID=2340916 RepID=A0A3A4KGX4_9NOCA|nr:hypothetical protein D5S18_17955 [Nocardia panacis]
MAAASRPEPRPSTGNCPIAIIVGQQSHGQRDGNSPEHDIDQEHRAPAEPEKVRVDEKSGEQNRTTASTAHRARAGARWSGARSVDMRILVG